jgi:hypothetical protein
VLAGHAHARELYLVPQEVGQALAWRRNAVERRAVHGEADRIIAHFWNPPYLVTLVEVVPRASTSIEDVRETEELLPA